MDDADADGRFTVLEAPLGDFVLHAQDAYGLTAEAAGRIDDVTQAVLADVQLPGHGAVQGVVKDASGTPLTSGDVALRSLGPLFDHSGLAGADGTYSFERVALGSFLVQARAVSGLTRTVRSRLETAGETASIDVQLPATGSVTGSVYAPDGVTNRPYSYVHIEAADGDGPLGPYSASVLGVPGHVLGVRRPDRRRGVSASDYYGYYAPGFARVAVTAGATATANVVLGSGVSLPADLVGADGSRATVAPTGSLNVEWAGAVRRTTGRWASPSTATGRARHRWAVSRREAGRSSWGRCRRPASASRGSSTRRRAAASSAPSRSWRTRRRRRSRSRCALRARSPPTGRPTSSWAPGTREGPTLSSTRARPAAIPPSPTFSAGRARPSRRR